MQGVPTLRDGSGGNHSADFDNAVQRIIAIYGYPNSIRIKDKNIASLVAYGDPNYIGKPPIHRSIRVKAKLRLADAVCISNIKCPNGDVYQAIRCEDPEIDSRSVLFEKIVNNGWMKTNGSH